MASANDKTTSIGDLATVTSRGTTPARVIELVASTNGYENGIALAYAGWQLAGMGAEVTRLDRTEKGSREPQSNIGWTLDALTQGKSLAPYPGDATQFERLLDGCDILLCNSKAALAPLGLSVDRIRGRFPDLIIAGATTFGSTGPYADYPGAALDAQALSAMAWALGEPQRPPLSVPPGITEHLSGATLAAGCLLALMARDAGARGQLVDVALAEVLASCIAGSCRYFVHHGLRWERSGRRASGSGGAYPFTILPCKDGLVCICGRTRDEWRRFVHAMGDPAWAFEARYQKLRVMGREYPDEVDALIMPWLARHSRQELEAIALDHGLIVSPLRELDEVLGTSHFKSRGFLVESRAGDRRVEAPGLPFRVIESREAGAPVINQTLLAGSRRTARAAPASGAPLKGVRVLDLGWVWSAPWVSTILGELGAEVIKLEHAARPDNLRLAGRIVRNGEFLDGPSTEMSPMFHQVNHGKLGITLNIKHREAAELLLRLVAQCDVVIENMSPGSLERSGLGYEAFKRHNKRLVMLAMSVAGQFGSLTRMRAYAPTMSSFVGMESIVGYRTEEPLGALNLGLSDPGASLHALVPLLAALRRARATGIGCYIDFSQIEALLGTLRPYLLERQLRGRQPRPLGNSHPEMAPHGIYPAKQPDTWLTLAAANEQAWCALTSLASDQPWARDNRYATGSNRLANVDALDRAIAAWTSGFDRDELVDKLRRAGLASSPVLGIDDLWTDPHFAARGMHAAIDIPVYGEDRVFRAPWHFSDFEPKVSRCGPSTGEHNRQVFGELLGLSADDIDSLIERGIIA